MPKILEFCFLVAVLRLAPHTSGRYHPLTKAMDPAEAEISQLTSAYEKAKQVIRDYHAMRRQWNFGASPVSATSIPALLPSIQVPLRNEDGAGNSQALVAASMVSPETQANIDLFVSAIHEHPSDTYTFSQIRAALAAKGHRLSRHQIRNVRERIVGKAPAFLLTPRNGSIAGVYSKVPVQVPEPENALLPQEGELHANTLLSASNGNGAEHHPFSQTQEAGREVRPASP